MYKSGLCGIYNSCINYKKDIDHDKDRNCIDGWKFCKNIDMYDAGFMLKCKKYCKVCTDCDCDNVNIMDGIQCFYNKKELQDKPDEFICAIIDDISYDIRYIITANDYDHYRFNKRFENESLEFLSVDRNHHTYFSTLQKEYSSKFKLEDIDVIKDMIATEYDNNNKKLTLYIINTNIVDIINDKFIIKSDGFYPCNKEVNKQLYLTDIPFAGQMIKDIYFFGKNYFYTSNFKESLKMNISMALTLLHKIRNTNDDTSTDISWRLSKYSNIIEQSIYYN